MKQFVASKGFVFREGKVLILREAAEYKGGTNIGKYVLPGGKIKPGETHVEALKREMREECGLKVKVGRPFFVTEWRPEIEGEKIQIIALFFECFAEDGKVVLDRSHDDFQWIEPADYGRYELSQASREAFEAHLNLNKL